MGTHVASTQDSVLWKVSPCPHGIYGLVEKTHAQNPYLEGDECDERLSAVCHENTYERMMLVQRTVRTPDLIDFVNQFYL